MGLRISTTGFLPTLDAMTRTQTALNKSLERLSTGRQQASFGEDMAASSDSVILDSQINAYTQIVRSLNDTNGILNTADSALGSQMEIVQKLRELAVQASSGTLSSNDRTNLNSEAQSLLNEYRRIASTTQFNGINLLDGTLGVVNLQAGNNQNDNFNIQFNSVVASQVFQKQTGSGTFQAPVSYTGGNTMYGNVTADINGDGKLDLIAANANSNSISLFLGNGDGSFEAQRTMAVGNYPQSLAVGDLNGDGIQDIVTADYTDGTVSILYGNGDGSFKPRTTLQVGTHPVNVALTNLGNGHLDIVTTDNGGGTISLILGNGNGTFQARQTLSTGTTPTGLAVGDLNGDGNIDLVVGNNAGGANLLIYFGNGNGTFQASTNLATTATSPAYFTIADANNDGKQDILLANNTTHAVNTFLGNGNGTFQAAVVSSDGNLTASDIKLADLNGDGNLDTIMDTNLGLSVGIGNGNGSFTESQVNSVGTLGANLAVGDFNQDGVPDVAYSLGFASTNMDVFLASTMTTDASNSISFSIQAKAQQAISIFDNALSTLKSDRAQIAAYQSRIQQTITEGNFFTQNYTDAKNSKTGVDIAGETASLTKNQILEQAQVAAFTQEGVDLQSVLKLYQQL